MMYADGTEKANLTQGGWLAWSPDGTRIAHGSGGSIWIDNLDDKTTFSIDIHLRVQAIMALAWSPDGKKIAFIGDEEEAATTNLALYVLEVNTDVNTGYTGLKKLIDKWTRGRSFPAWSPDSKKIAISSEKDGLAQIYVANADGSGMTRLTDDSDRDLAPIWSPDGTKIAFTRQDMTDGSCAIYLMNADGSGQTKLTQAPPRCGAYPYWSPDGKQIVFISRGEESDIYVVNADGTGQANLTDNLADDRSPAWSP